MPQHRIDLAEKKNDQCLTGCNKATRIAIEENSLCGIVRSVDDGLRVRCVGSWAREKIYFLKREFEIFSNGMKNQWKNNGLGYFEIGCGPGRCIDRTAGLEFDGTALAIVKSSALGNVKIARFIDIEATVVDSLNARIGALGKSDRAKAIVGSYNDGEFIADMIKSLNPLGLNLVFIDPTDCSVPFLTLQKIHNTGVKFDLIINVATKSDFSRNIKLAMEMPDSDVRKKYESFLGDPAFFTSDALIAAGVNFDFEGIRRQFLEAYQGMLRSLGFRHFGREEINGYYELVFASAHPRGLEFWGKAVNTISLDGQRGLGL